MEGVVNNQERSDVMNRDELTMTKSAKARLEMEVAK